LNEFLLSFFLTVQFPIFFNIIISRRESYYSARIKIIDQVWLGTQRCVVPFPVVKAIDLCAHNLKHHVRAVKLCRAAHHPWRYGRSHNRTRGLAALAVLSRMDPPTSRRTHPAARKAMPVRMQIFVHFAFCHPSGRLTSRPFDAARQESTPASARERYSAITQWRSRASQFTGLFNVAIIYKKLY